MAGHGRNLEPQPARRGEFCLEGDLSREEYHARRDAAQTDLDVLPAPLSDRAYAAQWLDGYLAELGTA